jgi:sigma-B regulation protein RsbU (phosphoserine phosphatase)
VLLEPADGASPRVHQLSTNGRVLGFDPATWFRSHSCIVPPGSKLFVFSDGAYEISGPDGRTRQLSDLIQQLSSPLAQGSSKLDQLVAWVRTVRGASALEDDLSLMELEL